MVIVAVIESIGALASLTVTVSAVPPEAPAVYVHVALPWHDAASEAPDVEARVHEYAPMPPLAVNTSCCPGTTALLAGAREMGSPTVTTAVAKSDGELAHETVTVSCVPPVAPAT